LFAFFYTRRRPLRKALRGGEVDPCALRKKRMEIVERAILVSVLWAYVCARGWVVGWRLNKITQGEQNRGATPLVREKGR